DEQLAQACFVAGTEVATPDGPQPIESLQPGDRVLSRDPRSGELAWRAVEQTFVTPERETVAVELTDKEGARDLLGATADHLFWVERPEQGARGWLAAAQLRPGDLVGTAGARALYVVAVTPRPGRHTVYNLEVERFHTYFVGTLAAWVHNRYTTEDDA